MSSVLLFAQEAVFAPFVSRLTIEAKNNLIRLTWKDSADVKGPVYVYRSQRPFDSSHPSLLAEPVEVPYGVGSYIDEIEEPGTWHYFIASSDISGQKYEIAIPMGNTISVVVQQGITGQLAVTEDRRPPVSQVMGIQSISASVQGDAVSITFRTDGSAKTPVLYRSVHEIKNTQDLLRAVIVQSGVKSPFTDYPVPGISYYYSIIYEEDISRGNIQIQPGVNATQRPVEIPLDSSWNGMGDGLRSMPLPTISINNLVSGIDNLPELAVPAPLSPEAAKAVADITRNFHPKNQTPLQKQPRAFAQDLETGSGGEDYSLKAIVQGSFTKRDWQKAKEELIQYLSIPRTVQAEARARFYLGQSYYFTAAPREALFEFLLVQNSYEEEAAEWIQATLIQMNKR